MRDSSVRTRALPHDTIKGFTREVIGVRNGRGTRFSEACGADFHTGRERLGQGRS